MDGHTRDIADYLVIIKRKKLGVILIASVILVLSTIVALFIPPTYKSSATILIEQQSIPSDLVRSTVTSYAAERIQTIQARVMSRTNLLQIIEKFDLYADVRKKKITDEIIADMRDDVGLDIISANVVDPNTGRPGQATIAFSLSFKGGSPGSVQKVASELTSLYLNENIKSRTKKAEETSVFLREESKRLGDLITELEKELSSFKQKNADALPEMQTLNNQMLQRSQGELSSIETSIQSAKEKLFYIEGQISQLRLNSDQFGSTRSLSTLESEYARAQSHYSSGHPDIVRMKKEIDAMKETSGVTGSASDSELASLKDELNQLLKKYTASHPDVKRVSRKIEIIEMSRDSVSGLDDDELKSNPLYVTLNTQKVSIESEMKSLASRRQNLVDEIIDFEDKLIRAPEVEREYLRLTRDYQNALAKYKDTKAKEMQADVAKQLESENKGERFTLIDPPLIPEKPISPNRPLIMTVGVFLALSFGLGYAILTGVVMGFIQGGRHVESITGVAPLSSIPAQMSDFEIAKSKLLRKRVLVGVIIIIVVLVFIVHLYIKPLDVIWFRGIRKIDSIM